MRLNANIPCLYVSAFSILTITRNGLILFQRRRPFWGQSVLKNPRNDSLYDKINSPGRAGEEGTTTIAITATGTTREDVSSSSASYLWVESGKSELGLQVDRLYRRYKKLTKQKKQFICLIGFLFFLLVSLCLMLMLILIKGKNSHI